VWRSGWKQWLPAVRVRQFSTALGDRARDAQDPRIDLRQKEPPAIPVVAEPQTSSPRFSTPIPPPRLGKPLIRRPALPTIADESMAVGGDTLRPPGAVPPPPRGTPQALLDEGSLNDEVEPTNPSLANSYGPSHRSGTSMRHLLASNSRTPHQSSTASHQRESDDDSNLDVPSEELSAPQQSNSELPTVPYDPDSFESRSSTPNLHVRVRSRPQLNLRAKMVTWAVLALAATSLICGSWLTLRHPKQSGVKAAVAPSNPAPQTPLLCSVTRPGQRISPSILPQVAALAADGPSANRLFVGFAENATTAAGISVDPSDLDVSFPFREAREGRIVSVTPLFIDGRPSFIALRDNQPMKQARAVDAAVDFIFGLSELGMVRQAIGGTTETIWAVDAKANITDPRLSTMSGLGHAVTFRQGGQSGSIQLGWLTEPGRAMSGPFQVKSGVGFLGTPTVATNTKRALVVYAGRPSETEPWSIQFAFADLGQPPEPANTFAPPAGGPGGDSIAPAVVALPNQRWLLQWSEGGQGQRQVRIQTLDNHGQSLGLPNTVSPVGSNAGQGLLWSSGQRAVSLYVVSVGRSAELWATPIHCPQ